MGQETLKAPRVVLDTNMLVSALLFSGGRLAWLRPGWQTGRFVPLVSRDTANELIRVLGYPKFALDRNEQKMLLAEYLPYAETVRLAAKRSGLPELRDPDDVMFLALARQGNAQVLVSGDADILAARDSLHPILVMTPAEFADWLRVQS